MINFYDEIVTVLKKDDRFFSKDGNLLRNAIYEATMQMDDNLIKLLLNNKKIKERFFTNINGICIFDKVGFGWVINNRKFLPDSYTRFKNKIGLTKINGDLISNSNDVELVFPYKDCVLEGDQTTENNKREEMFYNETLAPDEVDRLLFPKVLTNAKLYTNKKNIPVDSISLSENLIIKGNNLLAISSLLKKYEEKIKCIYIDPPYNTGGDSNIFSYNNTFNHSTWLTFMKNRLQIAKKLLSAQGFITIAIDHNELFYLGVLADEIFGRENFISIITVQHNPKGRNQAEFFSANSEFLLVYAKDKSLAKFNKVAINDDVKAKFIETDENGNYCWMPFIRARTVWSKANKPNNWYPIYVSPDLNIITSEKYDDYYEVFPKTNNGDFSWKKIKESFNELNKDGYFKAVKEEDKIIIYHKYYEQQVLKNVWIDKKYQSEFNGTNLLKELIGKNIFSYPKSLYAVSDIIKITSSPGDIILDFFGGSGTTAHAVMELNKETEKKRSFIIIEQLDSHIDITLQRMQKVMDDNSSFVYCELAKCNQYFIDEVIDSTNDDRLIVLLKRVIETGFISSSLAKNSLLENMIDFMNLSIDEKKRFIIELLDKNMLYVNYCDLDDEDFKISINDKAFTRSFYREV